MYGRMHACVRVCEYVCSRVRTYECMHVYFYTCKHSSRREPLDKETQNEISQVHDCQDPRQEFHVVSMAKIAVLCPTCNFWHVLLA